MIKLATWMWIDRLNTLKPRENGRHFPDDNLKCNSLNAKVWISIKISLKFVSKGPINNIPVLVQIIAWRRPGDKPLSETMQDSLLTHICVTRPQWVNFSTRNGCFITSPWDTRILYPILCCVVIFSTKGSLWYKKQKRTLSMRYQFK